MDEIIELNVNAKDKKFMFDLGRLFASGKRIKILNIDEVNQNIIEEEKAGFAKSFNMMIKYWQDNNLSPNIYKKDKDLEKLFLICPVRNATKLELKKLNSTISKYEGRGYKVHYPERDTNQNPYLDGINTGGYSICLENANGIASSSNISIFYNKESTGSMFDLGVTYQVLQNDLNRNFVVENFDCIAWDQQNYIDQMILGLLKNNRFNHFERRESYVDNFILNCK